MSLSKKLSYLTVFSIVIMTFMSSCTQEIAFRNPALQGTKDSTNFWLAFDVRSYPIVIDDVTYYIVEANNGNDNLTFQILDKKKGSYLFGTDVPSSNFKKVKYTTTIDNTTLEYTTAQNRGSGEFIIKEIDEENNTISGVFDFNAIKTNEADTIYNDTVKFTRGIFNKIPIQ